MMQKFSEKQRDKVKAAKHSDLKAIVKTEVEGLHLEWKSETKKLRQTVDETVKRMEQKIKKELNARIDKRTTIVGRIEKRMNVLRHKILEHSGMFKSVKNDLCNVNDTISSISRCSSHRLGSTASFSNTTEKSSSDRGDCRDGFCVERTAPQSYKFVFALFIKSTLYLFS